MEVSKSDSPLKTILNSPLRSAPNESASTSNMPPPLTPRVPGKNVQPQTSINTMSPMSAVSGDPASSICLQNVVATINLGCELNLTDIYFRTRNSEYNPSRFSGVVMRIREPRVTALVFRSGKIVCTGARSEKDALLAGKKFARIIQKLGFPVVMKEFTVQNMVATCDLRFPIKLEHLHQLHGQFSSYEPELFQGLIYRMIKPRLVVLVFVNGKLVFTGCKSRQDIKEAFDNILPILKSFRKN